MVRRTDTLSPAVFAFWHSFLEASGRDGATPLMDVFHFCDNEPDAIELAGLVLAGTKVGTASLVWMYEARDEPVPATGDLSIVTDWHGAPLCIIGTTQAAVVPFEEVGAGFAASKGEGYRSLEHWRRVHWDFFGRECARLGREPSRAMPVVCENFRVVHRQEEAP